MKKTILTLSSSCVILLSSLAPLLASADTSNELKNTDFQSHIVNRKVNALHMLTETGFDDISPEGSIRIATFDDNTNTITYQNGIDALTPDHIVYDTNELVGYKSDGTSTKLTSGEIVGNTMLGDKVLYKYKLSSSEKAKYTHYDINAKFHDPTWGYSGSAYASFTLN